MDTHGHPRTHSDTHGHTRTHTDTNGHKRTHTDTHGHTHTRTHTDTHTRTHTDTHGHTRTNTDKTGWQDTPVLGASRYLPRTADWRAGVAGRRPTGTRLSGGRRSGLCAAGNCGIKATPHSVGVNTARAVHSRFRSVRGDWQETAATLPWARVPESETLKSRSAFTEKRRSPLISAR